MKKYIYLDRDGVINVDGAGRTETGYVMKWDDFEFAPGFLEGLKKLCDSGYEAVILSNQQCVGKGYCSSDELNELTADMVSAMEDSGCAVAGVYYCTHLKTDGCDCRKPRDGLFIRAKEQLGIDSFEEAFYVGDTERDIAAGRQAGLGTILVLTGKSKSEDVKGWAEVPDHICKDMIEVSKLLLGEQ